ncbi:uncharacterized protein METZ01_LOCUS443012, partial [marine metagenome]
RNCSDSAPVVSPTIFSCKSSNKVLAYTSRRTIFPLT